MHWRQWWRRQNWSKKYDYFNLKSYSFNVNETIDICAVWPDILLFTNIIMELEKALEKMLDIYGLSLWLTVHAHSSRLVTKPTKWPVRPAKTQISLGICPVWSESSLSAWRKLGSLATHLAHSEDSDQTGRMPRLIWVFAGHTVILLVLSWGGSNAKCQCPFPPIRVKKFGHPKELL